MALVAICLLLLRLFHLDADFPGDLDWSGDLYTDEGWYANAAARHALSASWFVPGDFNPAVNMPVGQLLHSLFISLFGLNLMAARLPDVCAFAVSLACMVMLVRPRFGDAAAWLAGLVFSANFAGFAYSRAAFMEPIGVAFVSLAMLLAQRGSTASQIKASLMGGCAMLVKSSMIFVLPVLVCFDVHKSRNWGERFRLCAAATLPALALQLGWQLWALNAHGPDYRYFVQINIQERAIDSVATWLHDLPLQLQNVLILGDGFVFATVLLAVGALVLSASFRRDVLVRALVAYCLAYFFLLSLVQYGPPRYFVPLLFPLSVLCAVACREWMQWFVNCGAIHRVVYPALLVATIVFAHCKAVMLEFANPQYSMRDMGMQVGRLIAAREGGLADIPVLGAPADMLSLMIGVKAINPILGTAPLAERLARTHPRYVLSIGPDASIEAALHAAGAAVTHLRKWDVYGNYLFNSPRVELWAVAWNGEQSPCTSVTCATTP